MKRIRSAALLMAAVVFPYRFPALRAIHRSGSSALMAVT